MSELRHDPVQRRWVIIASDRGRRPTDFGHFTPDPESPSACPFCPGNERASAAEIWRHPHDGPWKARVVANRFPALAVEGELGRAAHGQYDRLNGVGAHEVIVESPAHETALSELPVEHIAVILRAWRERLTDLCRDRRLRYVLIFKNSGWAAGASLAHPHSQLIATPITPRTVAIELESARQHYRLKERCLFCDILRQELSEQERVVSIDEELVTLCPYASRFPFEMHVLPRRHAADFRRCDDAMLLALARHLRDTLRRMAVALDNPPFNLMLHTAPNPDSHGSERGSWGTLESDWHWHIEILPRLLRVAGFEWGTGFYINPTAPETAARFLREVLR